MQNSFCMDAQGMKRSCTAVCGHATKRAERFALSRSGFFVDGDAPQRDEVCAAVAALKRAAEQFGEHRKPSYLCSCTSWNDGEHETSLNDSDFISGSGRRLQVLMFTERDRKRRGCLSRCCFLSECEWMSVDARNTSGTSGTAFRGHPTPVDNTCFFVGRK